MRIPAALLCLLLLNVQVIMSQEILPSDKEFIDSLMNPAYGGDNPGAVILAARDGRILLKKGYGMASLELNIKSNPDYLYPIASISKQFTTVSILQLAEKGKLSLKDDIRKFLPGYNTHNRNITIEHLLTHTSGILSFSEKNDFDALKNKEFTKKELVEMFQNDSLLFEPGEGWTYSNSGYTLLGLVVEKITGLSLSRYITENILIPAGMNNTCFGTYGKIIKGLVPYYELNNDGSFRPGDYFSWSWLYSAGDMISSLDDLLKWDETLYSEKLVSKQWLEKAWEPYKLHDGRPTNYGYGWAAGEYNGLHIIRHDGILGYLSDVIRIPEKHVFVAIFSNNGARHPGDISSEIALRLAGSSVNRYTVRQISNDKLKEYQGTYEINTSPSAVTNGNKAYRYIISKGDTLYSCRAGRAKYKLNNVGEDLFCFEGYNTFMKFLRDGKGRINRIELFEEPVNYGPNEVEYRTELPIPEIVLQK